MPTLFTSRARPASSSLHAACLPPFLLFPLNTNNHPPTHPHTQIRTLGDPSLPSATRTTALDSLRTLLPTLHLNSSYSSIRSSLLSALQTYTSGKHTDARFASFCGELLGTLEGLSQPLISASTSPPPSEEESRLAGFFSPSFCGPSLSRAVESLLSVLPERQRLASSTLFFAVKHAPASSLAALLTRHSLVPRVVEFLHASAHRARVAHNLFALLAYVVCQPTLARCAAPHCENILSAITTWISDAKTAWHTIERLVSEDVLELAPVVRLNPAQASTHFANVVSFVKEDLGALNVGVKQSVLQASRTVTAATAMCGAFAAVDQIDVENAAALFSALTEHLDDSRLRALRSFKTATKRHSAEHKRTSYLAAVDRFLQTCNKCLSAAASIHGDTLPSAVVPRVADLLSGQLVHASVDTTESILQALTEILGRVPTDAHSWDLGALLASLAGQPSPSSYQDLRLHPSTRVRLAALRFVKHRIASGPESYALHLVAEVRDLLQSPAMGTDDVVADELRSSWARLLFLLQALAALSRRSDHSTPRRQLSDLCDQFVSPATPPAITRLAVDLLYRLHVDAHPVPTSPQRQAAPHHADELQLVLQFLDHSALPKAFDWLDRMFALMLASNTAGDLEAATVRLVRLSVSIEPSVRLRTGQALANLFHVMMVTQPPLLTTSVRICEALAQTCIARLLDTDRDVSRAYQELLGYVVSSMPLSNREAASASTALTEAVTTSLATSVSQQRLLFQLPLSMSFKAAQLERTFACLAKGAMPAHPAFLAGLQLQHSSSTYGELRNTTFLDVHTLDPPDQDAHQWIELVEEFMQPEAAAHDENLVAAGTELHNAAPTTTASDETLRCLDALFSRAKLNVDFRLSWLLLESCKYLVTNMLATQFGDAQGTLDHIMSLFEAKMSGSSRLHLQHMLHFMDTLEKLVDNTAFGSVHLPFPPSDDPTRLFFSSERKTWRLFFHRARPLVVQASLRTGCAFTTHHVVSRQLAYFANQLTSAGDGVVHFHELSKHLYHGSRSLYRLRAPHVMRSIGAWSRRAVERAIAQGLLPRDLAATPVVFPWIEALALQASGSYEAAAVHYRAALVAAVQVVAPAGVELPPPADPSTHLSLPLHASLCKAVGVPVIDPLQLRGANVQLLQLTRGVTLQLGCQQRDIRAIVKAVTECFMQLGDWPAMLNWLRDLQQLRIYASSDQELARCFLCPYDTFFIQSAAKLDGVILNQAHSVEERATYAKRILSQWDGADFCSEDSRYSRLPSRNIAGLDELTSTVLHKSDICVLRAVLHICAGERQPARELLVLAESAISPLLSVASNSPHITTVHSGFRSSFLQLQCIRSLRAESPKWIQSVLWRVALASPSPADDAYTRPPVPELETCDVGDLGRVHRVLKGLSVLGRPVDAEVERKFALGYVRCALRKGNALAAERLLTHELGAERAQAALPVFQLHIREAKARPLVPLSMHDVAVAFEQGLLWQQQGKIHAAMATFWQLFIGLTQGVNAAPDQMVPSHELFDALPDTLGPLESDLHGRWASRCLQQIVLALGASEHAPPGLRAAESTARLDLFTTHLVEPADPDLDPEGDEHEAQQMPKSELLADLPPPAVSSVEYPTTKLRSYKSSIPPLRTEGALTKIGRALLDKVDPVQLVTFCLSTARLCHASPSTHLQLSQWSLCRAGRMQDDSAAELLRLGGQNLLESLVSGKSAPVSAALDFVQLFLQHHDELGDEVCAAMASVPARAWQPAIPQLFARLAHPDPRVRQTLADVIVRVGAEYPIDVLYRLVSGLQSDSTGARRKRNQLLAIAGEFRARGGVLSRKMRQVEAMFEELNRFGMLWEDLWISEISRLLANMPTRVKLLNEELALAGEGEIEAESIQRSYDLVMGPLLAQLDGLFAHTIGSSRLKSTQEQQFCSKYGSALAAAMMRLKEAPSDATQVQQSWQEMLPTWSQLQRRMASVRRLHLASVSPLLASWAQLVVGRLGDADAPADESASLVSLPGMGLTEQGSECVIESFGATVEIVRSKTRPKKIVMRGSDGALHAYLLKSLEDLHLDERIMQVLDLTNTLLAASAPQRDLSSRQLRLLRARTYPVIPLADRAGLIRWVDNLVAVFDVHSNSVERHFQTQAAAAAQSSDSAEASGATPSRPRSSPERFKEHIRRALRQYGLKKTVPRKEWPSAMLRQVYRELCEDVPAPRDMLAREFWCSSGSYEDLWFKSSQFAASLAVMSILGYVIGLGDRHLGNILVDFETGDVLHIDYNVCFEKGVTLPIPELVPFRLTQILQGALGVGGDRGGGIFRESCRRTLSTLRAHASTVLALLDPFVFDPIIEWTGERSMVYDPSGMDLQCREVEMSCALLLRRLARLLPGVEHTHAALVPCLARMDELLAAGDAAAREEFERFVPELKELLEEDARLCRKIRSLLGLVHKTTGSASFTRLRAEVALESTPRGTALRAKAMMDKLHSSARALMGEFSVEVWREHGAVRFASLKQDLLGALHQLRASAQTCLDALAAARPTGSESPRAQGALPPTEPPNKHGLKALRRVKLKLTGRDCIRKEHMGSELGEALSVPEHVDLLIHEATREENLCRMYEGWSAWI